MDLNIKSISPIKKSTEKVYLNPLLNLLNVHNLADVSTLNSIYIQFKRDLVVKGKVSKYMKDKATVILKSKRLVDNGCGSFSYVNELIKTNLKTFSCTKFFRYGTCKHLIAACI